ncbi:hypothetical protein V5799_007459 [Amblyomma americanum]|uniref:Uncharacterized protein n=1 Tax=Amblyomma americanum TaxID=6943 RepID=A0AAQ4FGV5_AMBAM
MVSGMAALHVEPLLGCEAGCVLSFGCWQHCFLLGMEGRCHWNVCYCMHQTPRKCPAEKPKAMPIIIKLRHAEENV